MENESNALYTCSECPNEKRKTFKSEKGLIRHKSSMHNDKLYKYKKYRCYLCNLSFKDKTNYVLHTEVYHEGRNQELAVCNDCGKQFKDKTQLSVHLQSKCGTVRRYKCDECDKLLMTQGSLYTHKLRHANKRRYMCRYCAKTFYTDGQCQVHERKHTKEKAFVCEVCNKGFSHRQSLITHTTIHTGVKPYACEACHSEFSCIGNLLKHRRTHANTCGKLPLTTHRVDNTDTKLKLQLNTPSNTRLKETKKKKILLSLLNDNKMINDNDLALNLDKLKLNKTIENDNDTSIRKTNEVHNVINKINDKSLIVKSEINDNAIPEILSNDNIIQLDKVKSESDNEKYFDDVKSEIDNDNIYNDDNDIDNIWIKEENMKDDDNDNDNVMVIKFESDMKLNCNEQNDNELFNDNVKNGNIYSESDTEYSLDLQTRLQKLRKTKNSIKNISHSESIKCKYCDRIFKNDSYWFKRHLEKHEHEQQQSNQRQFKCSCCKEVFVNKIERNEHQQKEHLDILHCSTCDKTFNHIRSIESHKKYSHKGEKRKTYTYICEKCGRSDFKSKTFLQQHNYLNECNDLIKQFKCNVCMKYFANKYTLNTHQTKLHRNYNNNNNNNTTTEVITFKCNYCFKSFNWKGQLKIHERSHTGEKPFKCQFCPKSFAYRESLITHNSLHTGIKPHLCLSCGARFSCIGNLLKHKRTHAATCGADTIDKQTDDNNKMKINIEKIRSDTNRLNMIGVHLKKIEHKTQL